MGCQRSPSCQGSWCGFANSGKALCLIHMLWCLGGCPGAWCSGGRGMHSPKAGAALDGRWGLGVFLLVRRADAAGAGA
jgi:hypothetical protein